MSTAIPRVVVLGGGVIGLATACELLSRSPQLNVTVLERSAAGEGASRYAGAMDIPYCLNEFQRGLVSASWEWHRRRGSETGGYRRRIPMLWYEDPGSDLQANITVPLSEDLPDGSSRWLVPAAARMLHSPAFVIDPLAWCRSLAREIASSGRGEVIENAEATSLEPVSSGGIRIRCADGRSFTGAHAVLALGPWLPGWNERLGAWASSIALRTKRVFGLNIEIESGTGAALGWPAADVYLHPSPSATSAEAYRLSLRHDEWNVEPDSEHPMAGAALERSAVLLDQMLGKGSWRITGHRVFVDSYTPGFKAVVEPDGALGPDITIVTATHGSGVRMGPGIAELAADCVLGRLGCHGGTQ